MSKLLIVIDMQNDFITGSLGTPEAVSIVDRVKEKVCLQKSAHERIIFTADTHGENYLQTLEGTYLPVKHCIRGTGGEDIVDGIGDGFPIFAKRTFGSIDLALEVMKKFFDEPFDEIEICGLCTDICVISNALILKAHLSETKIIVDASACAGTTPEKHKMALEVMKSCQVEVINEVN